MIQQVSTPRLAQTLRQSSPLGSAPQSASSGDQVSLGGEVSQAFQRPSFAQASPAEVRVQESGHHTALWATLGLVGLSAALPLAAQAAPPQVQQAPAQKAQVHHQKGSLGKQLQGQQESDAHQAGRKVRETTQQITQPIAETSVKVAHGVADQGSKFGHDVAKESVKFGHGVRDFFKGLGGH